MAETEPHPGNSNAVRPRMAQVVAISAIVVTPLLFSFHFISFMDAKLAGLGVALLLLSVVSPGRQIVSPLLLRRFYPFAALVALAVLLAILFSVGAITGPATVFVGGVTLVPQFALVSAVYFLLIYATASQVFAATSVERLLTALAASGVAVAILGLLQYAGLVDWLLPAYPDYDQRMYSVFGNQDLLGGYLALTLSLGVALALTRPIRRMIVWPALAFIASALMLSASRSAWIAAVAGCALALAMSRPPRRQVVAGAILLTVLGAAAVAVAPGATIHRLTGTFSPDDTGYRIRLWIWDGTARMIRDHALLGVGLGNFQYHSPRYLGEALHARGPGVHEFNHLHTLHAHSDYLEILAETGVVGAVLMLFLLWRLPRVASPAWPALVAALTFSLVNTTLHSPPHVLAVLLCAAAIPTRTGAPPRQSAAPRRMVLGRVLWVATAVLLCVAIATGTLIPSYLLAQAESRVDVSGEDEIEAAYARALRAPGRPFDARKALAVIHANAHDYRVAERQIESASWGLDTGEIHFIAGHIAQQLGDAGRAAAEYEACIRRWPDYLPAWEGWLDVAEDNGRDALLERALPWLDPAEAKELTNHRTRLGTAPAPPSPATDSVP